LAPLDVRLFLGLGVAVLLPWSGRAEPELQLRCFASRVGQYERIDFQLELPREHTNPFDPDEVEVDLQLTAPGGERIVMPAFHGQDYQRKRVGEPGASKDWFYPAGLPGWKARFAPMQLGRYTAAAVLRDAQGRRTSGPVSFECVRSTSKGFLRASRKDPRFLEFSQGQPFFALGQNLAFIGNQQYVTLSKAEAILGRLETSGANYLRVWACCEDWAMAIEARKSAWGRSWDWHPRIVPAPGGDSPNRRCLQLTAGTPLKVDPSHSVALRPGARYEFSGKVKAEPGTSVRLELHRGQPGSVLTSGSDSGWLPFRREFTTAAGDSWLGETVFRLEGAGAAWIDELSLKEAGGGPELLWEADVNRPIRGYYNPIDCFMLDELVAAAQRHGVYLQLCLITRDLYMSSLKDPASPEYERAIQDARKLLRYAVARWGAATSVAAWEYFNEIDPGLPTDRFYAALGEYLAGADPYQHLRTTSTWGPSPKDCRHPHLDIADVHFYLRPADEGRLRDEVDAVLERARWLRAQAPGRPVHLGEFGLANDKWQPTEEMKQSRELVDFHNALWASALSGTSGSALYWWWDRLDPRNVYPLYRPVSAFLADVPWTSGDVRIAENTVSDARLQAVGLQANNRAWVWLYDTNASWAATVLEQRVPAEVTGAQLEINGLPSGPCRARWWDTREGRVIREEVAQAAGGSVRLAAPVFRRDLAVKIGP